MKRLLKNLLIRYVKSEELTVKGQFFFGIPLLVFAGLGFLGAGNDSVVQMLFWFTMTMTWGTVMFVTILYAGHTKEAMFTFIMVVCTIAAWIAWVDWLIS